MRVKAAAELERRRRRAASPTTTTTGAGLWQPLPGPQTRAFESAADVIGYGGAAGGGKTDLALGLAARRHYRSAIFRRVFPSVRGIIERSREIFARDVSSHAKDSYNESLHLWRLADGRVIEFGAIQYEQDARKQQGQARDLVVFDEATEFPERIVRFVMAWNRTTRPDVQAQTLLTFNPPMDAAGSWVVRFFAPWLDPQYRGERAGPGELRWFTTGEDGQDLEVERGTPGARSRTFIPATLDDNPHLIATGYGDQIAALPEPLRSILRGNFGAAREESPWQIVPDAWVAAARARWSPAGAAGPQTGAGLDVARGGRDQTVAARLHGAWLAPLQAVPGAETATGPLAGALILPDLAAGVPAGVDVIGVGASAFDSLAGQDLPVAAVNFAAAARNAAGQPLLDRSGKLRFANLRAYGYWLLREALDPDGPEPLALPDDDALAAEIATPRWSLTARGVQVESKDDVIARVGHSPDRADALVIALLAPILAATPEVTLRWL